MQAQNILLPQYTYTLTMNSDAKFLAIGVRDGLPKSSLNFSPRRNMINEHMSFTFMSAMETMPYASSTRFATSTNRKVMPTGKEHISD